MGCTEGAGVEGKDPPDEEKRERERGKERKQVRRVWGLEPENDAGGNSGAGRRRISLVAE